MIHLVGLPHTSLDDVEFTTCAFTTKAVRWTEVLAMIGEPVTCYWGGGKNVVGCEVVDCLPEDERLHFFGPNVGDVLPFIGWSEREEYWARFNSRVILEIQNRIQPGDIIAIWMGDTHQRIVDTFKENHTIIEPAVGYQGVASDTFRCYESYAWMHHIYSRQSTLTSTQSVGAAFDAVIPNFLRKNDFPTQPDGGFALFMGRIGVLKGPHVAAEAAARAGLPLRVAGAGMLEFEEGGSLTCEDGTIVSPIDRYEGVVRGKERSDLVASASVMIVPTQYIEPFGTVHAESLMAGVPVVTTDWGVFTETVENGVDGYRFRTLQEAADAIIKAVPLRGPEIRKRAVDRFSLEAVAPQFADWFHRLRTLRDGSGGWYA